MSIGAHFDPVVDKGLVRGTSNKRCAHDLPAAVSSPVYSLFLTFPKIGSKSIVPESMIVDIIRLEAT